jgi:hypothetical protein
MVVPKLYRVLAKEPRALHVLFLQAIKLPHGVMLRKGPEVLS